MINLYSIYVQEKAINSSELLSSILDSSLLRQTNASKTIELWH